jgi:hypothetical protein
MLYLLLVYQYYRRVLQIALLQQIFGGMHPICTYLNSKCTTGVLEYVIVHLKTQHRKI